MIRAYNRADKRRLRPNSFCKIRELAPVLDDEEFYRHTLVGADDEVYGILFFRSYWKNNYLVFVLLAEEIPPVYIRELRGFLYDAIYDFGAERVQTDSLDHPIVNKMHMFFGFRSEGLREKLIYGQDYRQWAMLKGKDY